MHEDFWDRSATGNLFPANNPPFFPTTRISILFSLFRSCKLLNDAVLQCPDEDLWYITFYTTAKVCRTLSCLSNAGKIATEISRDAGFSSSGPYLADHVFPVYDASAIERAADLRGEAKRLRAKFRNLSPLVQNTSDEADIMFGFGEMIWAVSTAYEQSRGVEAVPLNFSIISGKQYSPEAGSSGDYLSSDGSGSVKPGTVLDFEAIEDGTWEELLAGIATAAE